MVFTFYCWFYFLCLLRFLLPFAWFPSRSSSATIGWACRNSSPVDSSVSPTDVPPLHHINNTATVSKQKQRAGCQNSDASNTNTHGRPDFLTRALRQLKCQTNLLIHIFLITVIRVRPAWADLTRDVFIRSLSHTQRRRQQMLQHLSTRPPTTRPRSPNPQRSPQLLLCSFYSHFFLFSLSRRLLLFIYLTLSFRDPLTKKRQRKPTKNIRAMICCLFSLACYTCPGEKAEAAS